MNHFSTRKRCPACGSSSFLVRYEGPYCTGPIREYLERFYPSCSSDEFRVLDGFLYSLCECRSCHMIFQQHVPDDELSRRIYNEWINPENAHQRDDARYGVRQHLRDAKEILSIMSFLGKSPSSLTFLDYGMGWSKWALMAKAFGCRAVGCEVSADRMAYAEENGIEALSVDDVPTLSYDFINTEQVFEHLCNPRETLRMLVSALKPNGLVKISVPAAPDIKRRLALMDWAAPKGSRDSLNCVAPLEHLNLYTTQAISKMSEDLGTEIATIPMKIQYKYSIGFDSIVSIGKNILNPLRRKMRAQQGYWLLRKRA